MPGSPRILDLYSGAGGAGMGYSRAGFDVLGVDLTSQPDYPFEFIQADALGVLHMVISGRLTGIDAIHASPPCQGYATLTLGTNGGNNGRHPLLIEPTRELLDATGLPYVIENVMGAPVRRDLVLCGEMFGLGVIRHRAFELGRWWTMHPGHPPHRGRVRGYNHGVFHDGPYVMAYGDGGDKGTLDELRVAMDMGWVNDRRGLIEAIPPAFTEYIGAALLDSLNYVEATL